MGRKAATPQASFFLIWWNKKPWSEPAEVLMESKPKDQCGVAPEEHKGRGQDSHWEGRKCLNSLTMTKWWEPVMLAGMPSPCPSSCLIPEWWEHSFLQLLAQELWAVLYSMCRDLLSTKVYIKQGHEFLNEQQCWGLRLRLKRRLVRDKLWQEDGHQSLLSPLLAQCPVKRSPKHP